MAGVNFTIDVKKKGIEFVQQYRKELEEIYKNTSKVAKENKELSESNEDVKESNEKLQKSFKNLNENIEKNESKFKKYGGTVVASLAVISGAVGKTAIELSKALNDQVVVADRMGVSFEVFQSLSKLSKQLGVDIEQVSDKLLDFSKDIDEGIIRQSGPAYEALKELGIAINDLAGLDTVSRLELISNTLNSLPDINKKNFYLDELKLKDISEVATQIGKVRDINNELRDKGLLISAGEAALVKEFTVELNTLFSDYNTVLTKLSVTALPEINSLLEQVGLKNKEGFDAENVRKLSENIIVLSGSVGVVIEVFKGFLSLLDFTMKSIVNLGLYISDILPNLVEVSVNEIGIYLKRLGTIGANINAELNAGASAVAENVGLKELAEDLREQEQKERGLADRRNKSREEQKKAQQKALQDLLKENAKAQQEYLNANEIDLANLGSRYLSVTEKIQESFNKIKNPSETLAKNQEEADKKEIQLKEEKLKKLAELEKNKPQASTNELETQEEFLKRINTEIEKVNLKYEIQGGAIEERNKELVKLYTLIKDNNELDEVEKLKAELEIKNLLAKDYFQIIQETNDLYAAGLLDQKTANEIIVKNLNDIINSEATKEEKMKAQIELNNIRLQQIEKEKQLQNDLLNARNTLLKETGNEIEAFEAQSQERLKIIEEEFKDSKDLAERLEIEKSLINIDRTKIQLDQVKEEIIKLEEETKKLSFLDFDQTLENQQKLIELKEKQIGLEKTLGQATKNTNENILFTNEKVVEIMGKSLDSIAEGFANVMAGTKSLGEQARETLADILKEINKVLIRQIALSIAGSISNGGIGTGVGGGIASLLTSVARNHDGEWSVSPDHTSGQYGLKKNETLRVLEVGESVLTKSQTKNLESKINNQGNGTAVFDTEQSANAIFKSNSAKKFFDNLGREKGWSNI